MLITAVIVLALSSYLAEGFGDHEKSLGRKLFYYQTAALARPFSPRLHSKIAAIYDQTGRFAEADRELRSFLESDSNKLQLAQVRIHERHFPEAGESLASLNPKNRSVQMLQSWVEFGEGNISKARADFAKVGKRGVGAPYEADSHLLSIMLTLPDSRAASALLRPFDANLKPWVDQMNSYASPASRGLETAELFRSLSLTRAALTTVNSVISTNADYVPAIALRFSINQELGQTRAAAKDRKILQKLDPTHKY